MKKRFLKHLQSLCGETTDKVFLLAVSGGVDSMVLCDLFLKHQLKFEIAHCNFQLRGEDSIGDKEFIQAYSKKHAIPLHVIDFETITIQEGSGKSVQMIARELRYQWFDKLRSVNKFNYIVTAHHAGDNIETVLLNMARGTGVNGLIGIRALSGYLLRPLLFAKKDDFLNYAEVNDLQWREDASNKSTKYKRNFVRHELIPKFEGINPNFQNTFLENMEKWEAVQAMLLSGIERFEEQHAIADGYTIPLELINQNHQQAVFQEWLKSKGFLYDQYKSILTSQGVGKQWLSSDWIVTKDRQELLVSKNTNQINNQSVTLSLEGNCVLGECQLSSRKVARDDVDFTDESTVYLDSEKLDYPLEVRYWKQGDSFIPLGMKGKKKLSDFMVDQKIALPQKEKIMVVLSGDRIIWVVNYRLDDRVKLLDNTTSVVQLSCKSRSKE